MRPSTHHPDRISTAAAKSQLALLLAGATPEKRAAMTVESLGRIVRLPASVIAAALAKDEARGRHG